MKILFKALAVIVVLLILAVVAVVLLIDPNEYKPQIQAQVKQSINRDLLLNGDISWSIFPTLGLATSEVYIQNPEGFNRDNLLEIKQVSVALELLPLFSGEVKIGRVTLDGFRFNMITNANGQSNLDGMSTQEKSSPDTADNGTDSDQQDTALKKLSLGGVEITNAVIEIQDLGANTTTLATVKSLSLGEFALGQDTDLSMVVEVALGQDLAGTLTLDSTLLVDQAMSVVMLKAMKLNTEFKGNALPNNAISASLSSNVSYELASGVAKLDDLAFKLNELELTGWASVQAAKKTKVRFELAGNVWDLEPYMSASSGETNSGGTNSGETKTDENKKESSNQEPDLSALLGLDVNGTLTLAGMKAAGLTLNKISSKVIVANGQAKLAPLTANLYQGKITVNAMIDHAKGRNKYQVTKKISGIQILPLMKDLAQLEIVSGATELNITARGTGLSPQKIKRGLIATGDFKISDGALYGINIPQKIRSAKAMFGGKSSPEANDSQQTDFSSLTGKFKISQGVFNNTNLSMLSPLIRLKGAGTADIIKELINYKLGVTVVASLEGQGSDDQLKGVTIPLKVSGSFSEPKFGLDTSGALKAKFDAEKERLKQKAKDTLKEKYEDKLKEKLKGKLGGLFG